ncbi:MAG TPA: cystathionine beta-synthase [Aggregatilineales bacterium]|nr:cystathionine beta-synthase [Aggregatilineales bacterium]HPV06635.1 cystathionine beta-synthase [Aggregatilineales bacterium]HQA68224.1 cystathionine beta-synthase [Aggregatilineales bacterium]HQE19251.1 cystathionine beta-synthase [Aggregatilineales bacterium]
MSAQDSTAARADGVRMRRESYAEVLDNVLEAMGETPLIRLHQVTRDVKPDVLAKVEFFNPGGSVKDRIGIAIIEDAERSGKLKPGGTIVESTSGNTGVGLAVAAAIKGYKTVFVMPDKMSDEKIQLLRAFGARVVVTPTAVEPDDPRSYYNVAKRIVEETPNAILANQYHNPVNPEVHYRTTGPEIWRQTNGRVDVFVAGMGTGGTISGVGRYLKEQNPNVQIVGVDPVGSLLYELFHTGKMGEAFTYNVEGIGEDFLPSTLDLSVVDDVVQVDDRESFLMTRRLVREEGLFVGGSSGSAVAGALKYIQKAGLGPDKTVVVLLPDSGSRYLSKIFNDEWMREHGYLADPWCEATAKDVLAAKTQQELIALEPGARLADVIALMKEHGISQAPVIENGDLLGMVREVDLLNHMLMAAHNHSPEESIDSMISTDITIVAADEPLEGLMNLFSSGVEVVFVTPTGGGEGPVAGILTKIDVLDYIATHCI